MRFGPLSVILSAITLSTATAKAQLFEYHPGSSGFASRGNLNANDGETLQGFHANVLRSLGEVNGSCEILRFQSVLQDQNAATIELFDWVVRHGNDSLGPSRAAADLAGGISGLLTPGGVAGPQAWTLTTSLVKPIKLHSCQRHFAVGFALHAAPSWPADGVATAAADASLQHSHSRQEDHAWEFVGASTVATHPGSGWTFRYGLIVPGVALQLGNGGPDRYGMGGMFPATNERLTARVRGDGSMSTKLAAVVLSPWPSLLPTSVRIGVGAGFWLTPGYLYFLLRTDQSGEGEVTILPTVPPSVAGAGRFYLQAAIEKFGILHVSNVHRVFP